MHVTLQQLILTNTERILHGSTKEMHLNRHKYSKKILCQAISDGLNVWSSTILTQKITALVCPNLNKNFQAHKR